MSALWTRLRQRPRGVREVHQGENKKSDVTIVLIRMTATHALWSPLLPATHVDEKSTYKPEAPVSPLGMTRTWKRSVREKSNNTACSNVHQNWSVRYFRDDREPPTACDRPEEALPEAV